jgi:hypothetical protein
MIFNIVTQPIEEIKEIEKMIEREKGKTGYVE